MLRVECSHCGDIVEFSGDAVGQGFMCPLCRESIESLEVEQFYEDMAPARTFQADDVIEQDATNALISDLEAQNTNLLNEITSLDNRIVELRKEVETVEMWEYKSYAIIGKYLKVVGRLRDELVEQKDRNSHPWKNLWAHLWN